MSVQLSPKDFDGWRARTDRRLTSIERHRHPGGGGGGGGETGPPGPQGPPGPTAVSTDPDNAAELGTDGLIFVPEVGDGQDEVIVAHQPEPALEGLELWVDLDSDMPSVASGIPDGGAAGQVLQKASSVDADMRWADSAQVYNATYGFIPRMRSGRVIASLVTNGTGSFLCTFSPPVTGSELYAFTFFNTNWQVNTAILIASSGPSDTGAQVIYNNGMAGNCQVDWIAVYRG